MENGIKNDISTEILAFRCPRFRELSHVPLYKEQVIFYIEEILKPLNINVEERLITPAMLNNYVKNRVVLPPKDKKYNQIHIAYLIVVCILKQAFSLNEICNLINRQIAVCPTEIAYDYFCIALEKSLKVVFETRDFSELSSSEGTSYEYEIIQSSVMAFAHKLFIQTYLKE